MICADFTRQNSAEKFHAKFRAEISTKKNCVEKKEVEIQRKKFHEKFA
jgi:hypothetical protein